jgi:hypothetical protein
LTLGANSTFSGITIAGAGTFSVGSYGLQLTDWITFSAAQLSGSGTIWLQLGGGPTYGIVINANTTCTIGSLTGAGTVSINSGYTLTLGANLFIGGVSGITFGGSGTLSIGSYTITINAVSGFYTSTITGTGTIYLNQNLYIYLGTVTISGITISGAGNTTIYQSGTTTQGGALTISVTTVSVGGTWANAGYGITIPSGSGVTWNVSGSITTASTPGTLTVNGTCYWYGNGITAQTSNTVPTFTLSLAGTGIFVGSPTGTTGTATTSISLSSTAISVNAGDG